MQDHIDREYEGIIASVTSFGVFVRLKELHIEGLVHITGLGNDYFNYDQGRHVLVGERTRQVFKLGDELDVRVRSVDLDGRQIDFELADLPRGSSRDRLAGKSRKPQAKNTRPTGKGSSDKDRKEPSKPRRSGSIRERLKRGDVP
ncbi:S1 RNA-binding domain-containing protein [Psychrosphaera algicola]|uniref:S1 RNA-binding domain-containing protein n=2 Tax=Psychrosphaera TaxID=907197 RepID=A0ABT5FFB3_9GAMM|nr:S1 RNA-binding domain-containing protein [Psychrosphaera sp. G1-22]MDC2889558.1 S1 RNA-binding domain-containing protein [Psychrosphaera sp. G1-22]